MMLEIRGVDAFYGMSHVLFGLSMTVGRGETVCLLGRNGAGKSTTLKAIMGLVETRGGELLFKGRSIRGAPSHEISRRGIGYVPQERRIFLDLTVMENLMVARRTRPDKRMTWTADGVLALFPDQTRLARRRGGQLSGGEQQMLAIARTLMGNPELLLLDEPSEGLAPLVVKAIRGQIHRLKEEGISVLLSEQNLKFATSVGERVYIIEKGGIRFEGTMAGFLRREDVQKTYLAL